MTCQDYQHQISLFLYEELQEADKATFETHLVACEACKRVFEEEKGLHYVLSEDVTGWDLPSDLLVESRAKLANELDRIEQKRAWWRIPTLSVVFTPMRLLESAALVAMGLALGVYVSNQQQHVARQVATVTQQPESQIISSIPANGSVSNLHVVSANPSTGQVELAGEIVQPLRMQGTLSDDTVRQLLLSALGDTTNSGSRLRAVEVLAPRANDETVKSALIQALVGDDNSGVRLHALQGLKQFATESEVRAAFMSSLENDVDAGIRFEAIDALTRSGNDAALAKDLQRFTKDDNAYVKMKALQFVGTHR